MAVDYEMAWDEIQVVFGLEGRQMSLESGLKPRTREFLIQENLVQGVLEYLEQELEFRLRNDVAPSFARHLQLAQPDAGDQAAGKSVFGQAVKDLHYRVRQLQPLVVRMDALATDAHITVDQFGCGSYHDLFSLWLKATIYSQLPPASPDGPVETFYSQAFKSLDGPSLNDSLGSSGGGSGSEFCDACKDLRCRCSDIISEFHLVNRKLLELDILERLTSDVVSKIIHARIESHVNESCQGSFTTSHLSSLESWLDSTVMRWIGLLYDSRTKSNVDEVLFGFRHRLCHFLYETYTKARIDQLFNIIIEFPESAPALEDIKECLARTDLRTHLTQSLKGVLQKKLLHLGVNTADILTAYIAAIRSLRLLDSSGVLLELVCEPVRRYLRTRDDTVRCIVSSLIDDSSSELAEELTKSEGLCLDESILDSPSLEELEATWETWQPDPIDAAESGAKVRRSTSDIISMLVNIYGSKELFVNEYRSLLSNRLLSQFSYETEREIRNLEHLKLRFGEAPLHQCEVMLKDVGDSKRINTALHSESAKLKAQKFPVNALILSAQFWPQFKQETLKLPRFIQNSLDDYTKAFETMKGNRTLVWKHHLGLANIDLEMGDKRINLTVSPDHAAIIYKFTEKSDWTLDALSSSLTMTPARLRRRIAFWLTQGLVKEISDGVYKLIEEGGMRRLSGAGAVEATNPDEESESVTRTSKDQRAEELQVFWSYIVNMLINLESLPLDRIFQMLKMFAMQGPSAVECDIEELRTFLDEKVWQHELVFSAGQYKLPKT